MKTYFGVTSKTIEWFELSGWKGFSNATPFTCKWLEKTKIKVNWKYSALFQTQRKFVSRRKKKILGLQMFETLMFNLFSSFIMYHSKDLFSFIRKKKNLWELFILCFVDALACVGGDLCVAYIALRYQKETLKTHTYSQAEWGEVGKVFWSPFLSWATSAEQHVAVYSTYWFLL